MKNKIFGFSIFAVLFLAYSGCNSSIYDIVEVEEPVEIKQDAKDPLTDIKEDPDFQKKVDELSGNTNPQNNKFTEKQVVSRSFAIQIGAFMNEGKAQRYLSSAQRRLSGENLTLKNIDGLYKIQLGSFSSREEAIKYLDVIKAAGYGDCFYLENLKPENK